MTTSEILMQYIDELDFFDLYQKKELQSDKIYISNQYYTINEINEYLIEIKTNIKTTIEKQYPYIQMIDISSITDFIRFQEIVNCFKKKQHNNTILISHLSSKPSKFIILFLLIYYLKGDLDKYISDKEKEFLYKKLINKNIFFSSILFYKDTFMIPVYNINSKSDNITFINFFKENMSKLFLDANCFICNKDNGLIICKKCNYTMCIFCSDINKNNCFYCKQPIFK